MDIKTTRDQLRDGDVFYFVNDPQYIHELFVTADGEKDDYVVGSESSVPFDQVMAKFRDVVVVHNVAGQR
jgi:hypothetical protein